MNSLLDSEIGENTTYQDLYKIHTGHRLNQFLDDDDSDSSSDSSVSSYDHLKPPPYSYEEISENLVVVEAVSENKLFKDWESVPSKVIENHGAQRHLNSKKGINPTFYETHSHTKNSQNSASSHKGPSREWPTLPSKGSSTKHLEHIYPTHSNPLQTENTSVSSNSKSYASILLNEVPMRNGGIKSKIEESTKNEIPERENVKTIVKNLFIPLNSKNDINPTYYEPTPYKYRNTSQNLTSSDKGPSKEWPTLPKASSTRPLVQSENTSVSANSKSYASILLNKVPMGNVGIKFKIEESKKNVKKNRETNKICNKEQLTKSENRYEGKNRTKTFRKLKYEELGQLFNFHYPSQYFTEGSNGHLEYINFGHSDLLQYKNKMVQVNSTKTQSNISPNSRSGTSVLKNDIPMNNAAETSKIRDFKKNRAFMRQQ